jgi:DNA-binding protein YbaB
MVYAGVAAVAMAAVVASRVAESPRMMFGGGGDNGGEPAKDKAGFLDQLKKAQEMLSPEMMQKYSQVGMKLEQVRQELAATEVESKYEGVTVVFSGTQAPMSVNISEEICAKGPEAVEAALTKAMKEAHVRSGKYAAEQMQNVYKELGINPAAMGMGGAPPA